MLYSLFIYAIYASNALFIHWQIQLKTRSHCKPETQRDKNYPYIQREIKGCSSPIIQK